MTESDKLQQALDRLIKKTKAGEINWKETLPDNAYMASFPSHSVCIGPAPDSQGVIVSLFDKSGSVFLEQTATSAGVRNPGGALVGSKILELYRLVHASTPQLLERDRLLEELA